MTITGEDGNWLTGRLTGALNLGGEEAGKERKAGAGTADDGEKISAFYAREQRVDGGCAFMDVNEFCIYVHMDKFERVDKEKARNEEGAEVKVAGKRPSDRSEGTEEKRQRNE